MPHSFTNTGYRPPKKSEIDPRNFSLEKAQAPAPFPAVYMTDISALPVMMQGELPDCVENSIIEVKKFHELESKGILFDLSRRSLAIPTVKADGIPFSEGTSLQAALNIAHSQGISESQYCIDDHTLDINTFINTTLGPTALQNATTHTIQSYAFVTDLSSNGLKNAIYQNGLIIVGAHIDANWWTAPNGDVSWAAKDILPLRPPPPASTSVSGHCFALYGYDSQYFYVVNWWSAEWGNKGYGYFGANDVPTIYEAATILDLTAEQIQALKTVQTDAQTIEKVIPTLSSQNPNMPQIVALLNQALIGLSKLLTSMFG